MAQRNTPSLTYAEYVSADPEASGQTWLARLQLIDTVRRIHPVFLERLSAKVFPSYRRLAKNGYDFDKILWTSKSPYNALIQSKLKSALSQWAAEFNADVGWLKDEALRTLRLWYVAPNEHASRSWNTHHGRPRYPLGLGDVFSFTSEGWETTLLPWASYRDSLRRRFEERLSNYERQTRDLVESQGLVRARRTYSPDNLEWFVFYQFAGMSSSDIIKRLADKDIHVEDSSVLKGIKAAAKLIGWGQLRQSKQTRSRKVR